MKVFYFKSQDISEAKRDENGIVETTPEGKTIQDDYYSIQLKIPKNECTIDWRSIVRWSKMELNMPGEVGLPHAEFTKLELYKGCASILEGMVRDIHEKIVDEEQEAENGGGPGEEQTPAEDTSLL